MIKGWENDSCETLHAEYSIYRVPVAAALWCGVPEDRVEEELCRATPVGTNALGSATLRHPHIKCLEVRIRAIHMAIDSGELRACREDGLPTEGHVAYGRRHVYGQDLKAWAKHIAPKERPAFLFDEVERGLRTDISEEAYKALKADCDANRLRLERANERVRELSEKNGSLETELTAARAMIENISKQLQPREGFSARSETTYQHIIGALLEYIGGKYPATGQHPDYKNESQLIADLADAYKGIEGMGQRTLEGKFPGARRSLQTVR